VRKFICDNCGAEFPEPLDQEQHMDKHGILTMYDLCAPCRKKLTEGKTLAEKDFFSKVKKDK